MDDEIIRMNTEFNTKSLVARINLSPTTENQKIVFNDGSAMTFKRVNKSNSVFISDTTYSFNKKALAELLLELNALYAWME